MDGQMAVSWATCNEFLINHLFLICIAHRLCNTLRFIVACSRTDWVDMAPVQFWLRMFFRICSSIQHVNATLKVTKYLTLPCISYTAHIVNDFQCTSSFTTCFSTLHSFTSLMPWFFLLTSLDSSCCQLHSAARTSTLHEVQRLHSVSSDPE